MVLAAGFGNPHEGFIGGLNSSCGRNQAPRLDLCVDELLEKEQLVIRQGGKIVRK